MNPTPRQFAAICFLVLMDHHGDSYKEAHPNYIDEKLTLLDMGYAAYGMLDMYNKLKVAEHLESWGISYQSN